MLVLPVLWCWFSIIVISLHSRERMTVNHDVTGSSPVGGANANTVRFKSIQNVDKPNCVIYLIMFKKLFLEHMIFVCIHFVLEKSCVFLLCVTYKYCKNTHS